MDEAGRGCLAGPVFAAAVIFPLSLKISDIDDSKKLTPDARERLFDVILKNAISWSVASVDQDEIDRINIHRASLLAMGKAVSNLAPRPEFILVDGRFMIPDLFQQEVIIQGDGLSQSIAAASILAKVSRDRWISEESKKYPAFSFTKHKGYGTRRHFEEIRRNGITPLHRKTFHLTF